MTSSSHHETPRSPNFSPLRRFFFQAVRMCVGGRLATTLRLDTTVSRAFPSLFPLSCLTPSRYVTYFNAPRQTDEFDPRSTHKYRFPGPSASVSPSKVSFPRRKLSGRFGLSLVCRAKVLSATPALLPCPSGCPLYISPALPPLLLPVSSCRFVFCFAFIIASASCLLAAGVKFPTEPPFPVNRAPSLSARSRLIRPVPSNYVSLI